MYENGKVYEVQEPILLSWKVSLFLLIAAAICDVIAFVSPCWIVSIGESTQGFQRLGLWEACFHNFIFPEDYVSKAYDGCWYIYYPEYKYISYWLNPPWFYTVQVLSIIALICNLGAVLLNSVMFCDVIKFTDRMIVKTVIGMQTIAGGCFVIMTILVGVMSKDRQWMPRPDHNRVSWSFGLAVFAGLFSILSVMSLSTYFIALQSRNLYQKLEAKQRETGKVASGFGTNYSDPMHGRAPTESRLNANVPSLFMSNIHSSGYGAPSYFTGMHGPGSSMVTQRDARGKPTNVLTSGATVSAKLREQLESQRAANAQARAGSEMPTYASHHSLAPAQPGQAAQPVPLTLDTTV